MALQAFSVHAGPATLDPGSDVRESRTDPPEGHPNHEVVGKLLLRPRKLATNPAP